MNDHVLESDSWHLEVSPAHGASIVALNARASWGWAPVMRPTPGAAVADGNVSRFACFILAPYSNRIRDARFAFDGREYQLEPSSPGGSVQHGDVRRRPWRVVNAAPQALECRIDSRDFTDVNFPFPFTSTALYRVDGARAEIALSLANAGAERMPAGFGLHPYFQRELPGASGDVILQFNASGVYDTGDDKIPVAAARPVPPELDFTEAREVGTQTIDHVFAGWDGRASLAWPGSGWRLEMRADPVFSHVVVFTAPDGTLAVEPVSHATDGFNLMARGVPGTGVRVLEPGESMRGAVTLELHRM